MIRSENMDYDTIRYHIQNNTTLKLLRKESASLIISFLYNEFKLKGRSYTPAGELSTALSDYIYSMSSFSEENPFPDNAINYLDRWSGEGILRKYYRSGSDIAVFDLTPGTEKAIEWFQELNKKEFVGTESRLLKIFDLFRELVFKSTDDPQKQLSVLEEKRDELDRQIAKIQSGQILRADERQIRENFFDIEDTSRKLLADFRQVEYNFRQLDRDARKKQVEEVSPRGDILGDLFEIHDLIRETDQGKSFRAFWEFLMSSRKQDELNDLIEQVTALPELEHLIENSLIEDFKINLIEAGDKVNKTTHQLIDQFRRFLDDNSIGEMKRIISVISDIKSSAYKIRDLEIKDNGFLEIDYVPLVNNILERPIFTLKEKASISEIEIIEGFSEDSADVLFAQHYIDREELKERIRICTAAEGQVTLKEIINRYPVEKGLSEILAYLDLADSDSRATVDDEYGELLFIGNCETGKNFKIRIPSILFNRRDV